MKTILIIEDDKSIAELERDYLQANGFAVTIVTDGEEGLEEAEANPYDLVVLDLMLPGVDGFEICRRLRKKKDTPILMVSARKEDVDKIQGLGLGADDYMTKPFSPSELVARVKAHINRFERLSAKRDGETEVISVGSLSIEKQTRRVLVEGKDVALANKEFDILLFLASHPNIVFSKDELFVKIWGMEALGETATVTVHINRIREKIEPDPSSPRYIETVWGAGYRFRV